MTAVELDIAIEHAVSTLDTAIIENRLHDDPLRHIIAGLIAFLKAQRRLYASANHDLAAHLEQARAPVQDEALRRAVVQGIGAHATSVAKSVSFGVASGLAGLGLALGLVGFVGGAWWQSDQMAAQVDRANRMVVEAKELGSVVLSAKSAAIWTELVRMNPDVADEMRACQPLKQPAGSACSLPVWTLPPPPKMETPATH